MKRTPIIILLLAGALALGLPGAARAAVTLHPDHPARTWERVDFELRGLPTADNNYDPAQIRIDAEITAPSGAKFVVPVFWSVDIASSRLAGGNEKLWPTGGSGWHLRFLPAEAGEHNVAVSVSTAGGPPAAAGHLSFRVEPGAQPAPRGWVRVAADHRTLETSDGRALRFVGENVCWATGEGTYAYERWFDRMQASGQNVARLWMCPWWLALEQKPTPATQYQQDAAAALDRIVRLAEERGIYLLLCLDFHGMLQVDNPHWGGTGNLWPKSPYHQNQGGPGVHPNDFFTDARAKEIYQKRLRYLIGRYGATTHLLAWQFFNEIDNVYAPHLLQGPDVAAWHGEMGRWLKAHDPYHHLVTTSLTGGSDRPEIWSQPEMDFAMYHSYGDAAPAKFLAQRADDYAARYGKPFWVGEYGVDWRGWGGRTSDPHQRAQRQALWGSALSNAAGAALSWWWEEIDADGVYPLYAALTSVLRRGGAYEGVWKTAVVDPKPEPAPALAGEMRNEGAPHVGAVALNDVYHQDFRNAVALTGPLSAKRAAEQLSAYLRGPDQPARQRPLRLDAWWSTESFIKVKVGEVEGAAELVVRIDGQEAARQAIPKPAGPDGRGLKVDAEVTVPVPAGHHQVELANLSGRWLMIENLHVQAVLPATFAGGWEYPVEVNAIRQGGRAILYAVSPAAVYPAGANLYRLPVQSGPKLTLHDWPAGRYTVTWLNPETGAEIAHADIEAANGALALTCPDFEVDLAAIVAPAGAPAP